MATRASAADLIAAIRELSPDGAAAMLDGAPALVRHEVIVEAFGSQSLVAPMLRVLRASARIDRMAFGRAVHFGWMKPPHPAGPSDALAILFAALPPALADALVSELAVRQVRKAIERQLANPGVEEPALASLGPISVGVLGMAVIVAEATGYGCRIEPDVIATAIARHRGELGTPWLAALLFVADASGIEGHAKRYLPMYEAALGKDGVPPIVALLQRFDLGSAPRLYAWIATHDGPDVEPALLEGLRSGHKRCRSACVEALAVRAIDVALVIPLLRDDSPLGREAAADLLERRADPAARSAIDAALAIERSKGVCAALERAAASSSMRDDGRDLETRFASMGVAHAAPAAPPGPLRDRVGRTLSAHACAVLASRLALESEVRSDALLEGVDELLDPSTAAAWAAHGSSPWARARLADAAQLDAMGAAMADRVEDWAMFAAALGRRRHPVCIAWLEHLALRGWSELARKRGAQAVAEQRPDPQAPPPEPGVTLARARWLERMEERMVAGAPVPVLLAGLVYEVDGRRALATKDGWVDRNGRAVDLGDARTVVHPAMLAEEEARGWSACVAALNVTPPFPQMARPVFRFERPAEAAGSIVESAARIRLELGSLRSFLETRGYVDGPLYDILGSSPVVTTAERNVGPFYTLVMRHEGRYVRVGEDEAMAAHLRADAARTLSVEVLRAGAPLELHQLPPSIASELRADSEP